MFRFSGAVLSAALLATTFAASPSQAALQLAVTDNYSVNTDVVNDCTIGGFCAFFQDTNGNPGQINATVDQSTFGVLNVNSAQIAAAGSPALADGQLSLTDLDIESGGPSTIYLYLTNTGLTSPTGPAILNESLSATTLSGSATVSLQGFEDNGNHLYGMPASSSTPLISLSPVAGGAAASSMASSSVLNFASPYSLTEVATINFLTAAHLNLNFTGILSASPVPEPASMLLFATVLAGTCLFMRKRMQTVN